MGFVSASDQGILVMQNPKSGSGRLNPRKIWNRTRSKSQPRSSSNSSSFGSWTSLGNGTWITSGGRQAVLTDSNLFNLTEVEASALQQLALAKLQAMDLGCSIQMPKTSDDVGVEKRKRKALALKKRALTTGFFENSGKSKTEDSRTASQSPGMVFGVPLAKCIHNDKANRRSTSTVPLREVDNFLDSRLIAGSASAEDITNERYLSASRGICESQSSCNIPFDLPNDKKFFGKDNEESFESLKLGGKSYSMSGLCFIDSLQDWPNSSDGEVDTSPHIPHIVNTCFNHLETNGLHRLGIFRISSSKKRIKQLREDFDCGKEVQLSKDYCPHDIATLLKEYFRDLPEPLLTRELYMAFVGSQRIRNRRQQMDCLSYLIQLLPIANRDTLWALLRFLNIVALNALDHRAETGEWVTGNKMDSHNLATLFGPNVLHMAKPNLSQGSEFQVESAKRADERIEVIKVVRTMIDNYKELFEVSAFLLDELYHRIHLQNPELLARILTSRLAPTEIEIDPDTGSSACSETTSISHLPIDINMELSSSFVIGVHGGESSSGHWERSRTHTGSLTDHEAIMNKPIERNSSNESIASAKRPERGGSLGREIYSKAEAVTSRLFRRRGKSTTRDGHEDSPQRFEESSYQWFKRKGDKPSKKEKSQTRKREPSESDGSGSSDQKSTNNQSKEVVDVRISNSRPLMRPDTSPKLQSSLKGASSQLTTAQQVSVVDIRKEHLNVPDFYEKCHTVPSTTDTEVISASLTLKVPLARSKTGPALAFGQGIDIPFIEDAQSDQPSAFQRRRVVDKRQRPSNVQESEATLNKQSPESSIALTAHSVKSKMAPLATSASTSAIPAMRRRSKELNQGCESPVTTTKQASGSQSRCSGATQSRVYQRQRSRTKVTESSSSKSEEINNNPSTSNVQWPQERWKRWEIISSEHTEQETVV